MLANAQALTTQDIFDYYTGNDLDLSKKGDRNTLNTRLNKLTKRLADSLGQQAWSDAIDRDANARKALDEFNKRSIEGLSAQLKPDSQYDNVDVTAFQESFTDGDVEAQGGNIEWIWENVLGQKEKLKRTSQKTRDAFHQEALDAAAAGLIPSWAINAVKPAAAGGKAGIPRRGGMYYSTTDPKLTQLLEVAEANYTGPTYAPKRVHINDKSLTPEAVKKNKEQQAENHKALEAFGNVIEGIVDSHPTLAAVMVHDAYKNTEGLIKISAPLKYASKNFEHGRTNKHNKGVKYREEHAVPASIIGAYTLSNAKAKTWNKIFPHIKKNFVQMMLSKKDDQKFDDAKLADVMPEGWKMTDNVLARYFNKHLIEATGGIDPDGLYDVESGQTIADMLGKIETPAGISPQLKGIANSLDAAYKSLDPTQAKIDMALWEAHNSAKNKEQPFQAGTKMHQWLTQAWGGAIEGTVNPTIAAEYLVENGHLDNILDAQDYVQKVHGFQVDNFIYTNPSANLDTPIHEFSHAWNKVIQDRSPRLFENIFHKIRTEAPSLVDEQLKRLATHGYKLEPESFEWKDEIMAGIPVSYTHLTLPTTPYV